MKPLSKATAALLEPIDLAPTDRLSLQIDETLKKFNVDIFQLTPENSKRISSYNSRHLWLSRIPERKELKGGGIYPWELAATDYTVAVINAIWPKEQLLFIDKETYAVYAYHLASMMQQERVADGYATYMARRQVPSYDGFIDHPELPLAPYQKTASILSMQSEGYGLFMEQGTGKTAVVIARICTEAAAIWASEQRAMRVIIVCPKNLRLNWANEIEKFCTVSGKVTVIRGGAIKRVNQMIDAFTVDVDDRFTAVICSYEALSRMESLDLIEWDLAVADEGHYFKSPRTARFKAMLKLRDRSKSRVTLTGTPITNTPLDLYAQFEFMGRGFSGFTSWEAWKSFYGVFEKRGDHTSLVGVQNLPFMQERLARYSFIIKQETALPDLPNKVYDVVEVTMTKRQEEMYEQLAESLAIEIENELDKADNKSLVVNNALTKLLRLAHITSGFITWDPIFTDDGEVIKAKSVESFEPNPKLEALIEEIKNEEDKIIVWAVWVHDLKQIYAELKRQNIGCVLFYGGTSDDDRAKAEYEFNHNPDCKVFIGNPVAGGTGLNLIGYPPGREDEFSTNCSREIFYSQNWSPTARAQAEARAHRRGTRKPVRITDLVVAGTIDEIIRTRVFKKIITALEVSDIRAILRNVLEGVRDE